jgi:hypothetical protein
MTEEYKQKRLAIYYAEGWRNSCVTPPMATPQITIA